jgi:hypothetical protein
VVANSDAESRALFQTAWHGATAGSEGT